jgi:hypothetical protein
MAITKVLAGASLLLLALVAAPVANAQNDGDGVTVSKPQRVIDPAKKAARHAKRQQRREMRKQARLQQQGLAPTAPSISAPR